MVGIVKTYDEETNELLNVYVKNDCGFDFHKGKNEQGDWLSRGYASLGTIGKHTPVECEKYGRIIVIHVYKNCNDEKPLFNVQITKDDIYIIE